ncbi:MAG: carboxypeptidase-like regulatory domain-containing protein, partial [Aquihabitans sp.]
MTADDTSGPLAGIQVCANLVVSGSGRCAESGVDGSYSITGLGTGDYRIQFGNYGDTYVDEYFDDTTDYSSAQSVAVVGGAVTPGIDAGLAAGGSISGTVTADGTSGPLAGIQVCANPVGAASGWGGCATTAVDGSYSITGLGTGDYRIQFGNYGDTYVDEYFDDTTDY